MLCKRASLIRSYLGETEEMLLACQGDEILISRARKGNADNTFGLKFLQFSLEVHKVEN